MPKAPERVKLHMAIRDAFVTLEQERLAQSPDKPYMTEREFWQHSQAKRVRRRPAACQADQSSEVQELDEPEDEPGTADVTAIDKEGEEDEKDEEAGGRGCESEDVTGLCDAQASEGGGA